MIRSAIGLVALAAAAQDFSSILSGVSRQLEKNAKVTALRFNCVPADCRVRPLETMIVQVLVDGEISVANGDPRKGRLHRTPGPMKVVDKEGGWLSKPFKFQGADGGGYVDSGATGIGGIFGKVAGDYTVMDSFLYTAPETAGTYTLENETEGIKSQVKVTVDAAAATMKVAETSTFGVEDKSNEPYRALAEHYAPMVAQETWWMPKADIPTRFDYDNDFLGGNNWENLEKGTSQAYVHYAVIETSTHWFLIYNLFHPRDYSDKCVVGSCHENDNEGLILTVRKEGSEFGKLLAMETLAHDNIYSFTNDSTIRNGIHDIDGPIEFYETSHPVIFVESGGHGIYGTGLKARSGYSLDKDEFTASTGTTFVYKGVAERAKHANDRKVGYELLPILTHWWARAAGDSGARTFDSYLLYRPFGGRPAAKAAALGLTFYGRKEAANKAKPFWGWHDNRTLKAKVLAVGQWGLDPAYAVSRDLLFPSEMPFSLEYTYNPYLGIGEAAPPSSAAVVSTGTVAVGSPAAREGWVEVEAVVDSSVVFHLGPQGMTSETLSGQPVTNPKIESSGPVPPGATWSVVKKSGRGEVSLVEQPSESNGQLLKVRVNDTKSGPGHYVFRATWRR
ncbi:MAG TPA: hypothetical protein VM120_14230 [Bryobacteraceae bacterium]|nr:hypothetical protein [Bryobacteraceae bacterium]